MMFITVFIRKILLVKIVKFFERLKDRFINRKIFKKLNNKVLRRRASYEKLLKPGRLIRIKKNTWLKLFTGISKLSIEEKNKRGTPPSKAAAGAGPFKRPTTPATPTPIVLNHQSKLPIPFMQGFMQGKKIVNIDIANMTKADLVQIMHKIRTSYPYGDTKILERGEMLMFLGFHEFEVFSTTTPILTNSTPINKSSSTSNSKNETEKPCIVKQNHPLWLCGSKTYIGWLEMNEFEVIEIDKHK